MDIQKIQTTLMKYKIDYWLLTDYHGRDQLTKQLMGLPRDFFSSRRWVYLIPKEGTPLKIVSHIEASLLNNLEGETLCYRSYKEMEKLLTDYLKHQIVAMQYSHKGMLPIISTTDGGFIELVEDLGAQILSSGDLIQELNCILSEEELESHKLAGKKIIKIRDELYEAIRKGIDTKRYLSEIEAVHFVKERYEAYGLTCDHDMPYIAVNDHATQMTFTPDNENSYLIKEGDYLLIDLWAREDKKDSIYHDVSFCAYIGEKIPEIYKQQFQKVVEARDKCLSFIKNQLSKGIDIKGCEVDEVCRQALGDDAAYFFHRTGHNIGKEVHGIGANLDSLESIDYRKLLPGTLFSIEPGIYKGSIGVRTEIDVYINLNNQVQVYSDIQNEVYTI